jgi:Sec-independent protein translocase protein TatA
MGFDAESLKFKVTTGRPEIDEREPCNFKHPHLGGVLNWIGKMNLDQQIMEELKSVAKRYPQAALPTFIKQYQTHIGRIREKLKEEKQKLTQLQAGENENGRSENEKSSQEGRKEENCCQDKQNIGVRDTSGSCSTGVVGQGSVDPGQSERADEDCCNRPDVHSDVQDSGSDRCGPSGECDIGLQWEESGETYAWGDTDD